MEYFGYDVVFVMVGCIKQFYGDIAVGFVDPFRNIFCHDTGGVPHCVIDYAYLVFLIVATPLQISVNDQPWITSPYYTVAWRDYVDGKAH